MFASRFKCHLPFLSLTLLSGISSIPALGDSVEIVMVYGHGAADPKERLDNLESSAAYVALAELLKAQAEERAAAEKDAYNKTKCERKADFGHELCLSDVNWWKGEANKPCYFLQATVGNVPHADPAGACYKRVEDQVDVLKSSCGVRRSQDLLYCLDAE